LRSRALLSAVILGVAGSSACDSSVPPPEVIAAAIEAVDPLRQSESHRFIVDEQVPVFDGERRRGEQPLALIDLPQAWMEESGLLPCRFLGSGSPPEAGLPWGELYLPTRWIDVRWIEQFKRDSVVVVITFPSLAGEPGDYFLPFGTGGWRVAVVRIDDRWSFLPPNPPSIDAPYSVCGFSDSIPQTARLSERYRSEEAEGR